VGADRPELRPSVLHPSVLWKSKFANPVPKRYEDVIYGGDTEE